MGTSDTTPSLSWDEVRSFHSSSISLTHHLCFSPAAVAVAVIRDDARPELPQQEGVAIESNSDYEDIMHACWHRDTSIRPTFLEIATRLSSLAGEDTAIMQPASTADSSTEGSMASSVQSRRFRAPLGRTRSMASVGGGSIRNYQIGDTTTNELVAVKIPAPKGEVTIVFTDITSAASLWEFNAACMKDSTLIHNRILRNLMPKYRGYETRPVRDRNAGEGSFCIAFQDPLDALEWCMDAQRSLLEAEWPATLLEHPGAAEEWGDTDDRYIPLAFLLPLTSMKP